ncbi:hypothetical protein KB20921_08760 [Edwardsiella ictaluri]|nr:hypothetical protein KH20906_08730 [Edwardsiella ictaluri]BEI01615.1 hypothetical protein KB20921_08760 [Edwardsiella ictaluri]BEI05084.1 hypothetical protein KH201010_08700 [Edwardsiella ictaluri]BEI08539.1 hypothetical protein STU22726_08700 [Edwardsiella ictaluri]BEI12022.1 hypothetical protein STU22816_08750 [Edwardsiella ictaluri]
MTVDAGAKNSQNAVQCGLRKAQCHGLAGGGRALKPAPVVLTLTLMMLNEGVLQIQRA